MVSYIEVGCKLRVFETLQLHSLYRSSNIVRVIKCRKLNCTCHVARMEEDGSALKILIDKPIGKRPLGRLRFKWQDNIRMNLKGIGINTRNWVDSAQDRDYWSALVNAALYLQVSYAMELVNIGLLSIQHYEEFG
jgi:hypothetical protein